MRKANDCAEQFVLLITYYCTCC